MFRSKRSNPNDPDIYGELFFDRGAKAFQCGRRIVFSVNVLGHLDWIPTCLKKGDLDPYLTIHKNELKVGHRLKCKN